MTVAQQEYYQKNKEKIKQVQKKYREANREKILANVKIWQKNNPEMLEKQIKNRKIKSITDPSLVFRQMFNAAKHRAKRFNRTFDLSLEYIEKLWVGQKGLCKLSRLPMSTELGSLENRVSLDRKNSKRGYVKGNVQLIRFDVNRAKNDMTEKQLIDMCRAVAKTCPK
jgi:hypothetical protein